METKGQRIVVSTIGYVKLAIIKYSSSSFEVQRRSRTDIVTENHNIFDLAYEQYLNLKADFLLDIQIPPPINKQI